MPKSKRGAISAGAGYELTRIEDPTKQAQLAQQVAERRLTRDRVSEAVKADRDPVPVKPSGATNRATATLTGGESVSVSASSLTLDRFVEVIESVLNRARRARGRMDLKTFVQMLRMKPKSGRAQN